MASPSLLGPAHASPPPSSTTTVKTTWAISPPNSEREPIRTERLLIRPFERSDVEAIYQLRKQPEVMQWTVLGLIDKDIEQSRTFVERFQPPKDTETYNFVVWYLGEASENKDGVLIGCGGCHKIDPELGWPELGYIFRKEYWNKGLATEFIQAFVKAWWTLPRTQIEVKVDAQSVKGKMDDDEKVVQVPELLTALIEAKNMGSRRVLEKNGFREYKRWSEPNNRPGYEGEEAHIVAFLLEAPKS